MTSRQPAAPDRQVRPAVPLGDTMSLVDAWAAAMRRGDFDRAWVVADRIVERNVAGGPCWHWPRHEQWVWDGRPLDGQRVLVRCYHGLGDTIQFARFLPLVNRLARDVVVWAQPALIPLLATMPESGHLLPLHDGDPGVDYDVDLEIMEIPHALRTDLATLPRSVPYFHVAPAPRFSRKLSVGIVARAGEWDPRRDVPHQLFAPLKGLDDVDLFSLQLGEPLAGAVDISIPDILEAAARLQALDLVISVDTMMAHLAGALGVSAWTLLLDDCDWRWMEGRSDSPWYPTMRLYRQEEGGGWTAVLERVARDLRSLRHGTRASAAH